MCIGAKSKFEEAAQIESERLDAERLENERAELQLTRKTEMVEYKAFIEDFDRVDFGLMNELEYSETVERVKKSRFNHNEELTRIAKEKRIADDKMEAENERLKKDKEEAEKVEVARVKTEAKAKKKRDGEKEESNRLARLQALSQQRSDDQAAQAIKDKEAAEQRERDAIATTERLEREKLEAEEKRVDEIKSLTKACSEITPEQLERAKAEGKTVFVKVVSIDFIEGQSGIFIQSSDN